MENQSANRVNSDFFIGWLPIPKTYRRFLCAATTLFFIMTGALAITLSSGQRDPGLSDWEEGELVRLEGMLYSDPYPLIKVPDTSNRFGVRTILLVAQGKFGARDRTTAILRDRQGGCFARVTGTILHRDGRSMMELADGSASITLLSPEAQQKVAKIVSDQPKLLAEEVVLHGEIIDPKCYLGAMKPGGGKTHKACAMLCISGGVPPMLVVRDAKRIETFYLLTTATGAPARADVLPFVGEVVEITGTLMVSGDLLEMRIGSAGIRRL